MNKKLNQELMEYAEVVLQSENCPLFKDKEKGVIHESYNGQVSALGVSTLMIGLKATMAVYFQDEPKQEKKAYRRCLLEVIVQMLNRKNTTSFNDANDFVHQVMMNTDATQLEQYKSDVVNCSVALKQVIRTYKLE